MAARSSGSLQVAIVLLEHGLHKRVVEVPLGLGRFQPEEASQPRQQFIIAEQVLHDVVKDAIYLDGHIIQFVGVTDFQIRGRMVCRRLRRGS